jgi:galactoside O-acetyltransferase
MFSRLIDKAKRIIGHEESAVGPWGEESAFTSIHPTAIIDPTATLKIFNRPQQGQVCFEIGEHSHVYSMFNLLRPQAKITVGKRCQLGVVNFVCAGSIEVQDDVIMAWGVTIMDNDSHSLNWNERKNDVKQSYNDYMTDKNNIIKNKDWSRVEIAPIKIASRSWIGFNAIILKGVTIGENAVVGAGSVVTCDVPPFSVVAGNPAKVIKTLEMPVGGSNE